MEEILSYLEHIRSLKQEHFVCLPIGGNQQIVHAHTVFIGTLTSVNAHPREVFAAAIADHAVAVIVAHNHPLGEARPSMHDISTTQQLAAAGQILGMPLWDHIIVTEKDYFSFQGHGLLLAHNLTC